jgi:hypothetical protein
MLKSTAIVLTVAVLVAIGVVAAILNQQSPDQGRTQNAPMITRSTVIVIDGDGARACPGWSGAASCVPLGTGEAEDARQQD